MNRLERYHAKKKTFQWKMPILGFLLVVFIFVGMIGILHSGKTTTGESTDREDLGQKVVIHLPNGQKVYTYEKLIIKKDGKTYYKGDRNTIDLTGGKVEYKNWK